MANYYGGDLDVSSALAVLKCLSNEELDALLNEKGDSNQRIDSLLSDIPQALEDERDKLIQDNKHLAEHNLSFESTYRVSKQQLAKAVEECHAVKTEMDKKHMKLREFSQQNSLDATLAVMQAAMAEMEEASEDIANAWLRKETSIDQFLKDFGEKRKLFHSRRAKVDEMPREISKVNGMQPTRPAPAVPVLPFASMSVNSPARVPNSAPYPSQYNFPQPHQY